ncbi:MAG: metallophosphoesterase family protein [Planctomycetes bacterium]|jgi:predicted phosphodiesterase|nr:metallophosphoesterase family protein [Planctomycetota bacterium]MBT6452940.1 metallophosphoesterase family protein [Planctomycetota bacterium]MBT6541154.1 metallophosphoesterase family protein [Planctomycetota bacterium]MBT6784726.1 metallophosphoesterase family protein [Planctomycetota bacterium]MBT6969243.1 metallophosphoesterase family protein [Planctomycetota bacterium]
MRTAIISDIHANLPALETVLADIESAGVDRIFCLGDVIGYGPEPRECLQLSQKFEVNLLGNHEEAVLFDPIGFNPRAKAAVEWTKQQLMSSDRPREENAALWKHLDSMKETHEEGNIFLAHGTPREPTREYLFVQDCKDDPAKVNELFQSYGPSTAFVGHTHVAGIFAEGPRFITPKEVGGKYQLGSGNLIINVGSVGQPRDGDPRASYVIVEQDQVEFRRIAYPIEETMRRFKRTPLPENLALRLTEGR